MWRILKRNYNGTSHKGAASNHDDFQPMGWHKMEENKDSDKEDESTLVNSLSSSASFLLPKETLLEEGHEGEGTWSDFEITEDKKEDLEHDLGYSKDLSLPSEESKLVLVKSCNIKEISKFHSTG